MMEQIQNKNQKILLALIFSVTLASALGLASITPALPKIARELSVSKDKIGLIFAVFALPSLLLTPVLGIFADRYGRKIVLVPALILFGIAGFACTFTSNFSTLLIFRFLQGCGASSLGALNVTLIGDLFDEKKRFTIMGYNNSVLSIGTSIFPIIGGWLAEIKWSYPFILPLLAIPVAIFIIIYFENIKDQTSDPDNSYKKSIIEGIQAMKIQGIFLLNFTSFLLLFGCFLTYTPFVISQKFTENPLAIGMLIASMSVFQAITSSVLGRLSLKFNRKALISVSMLIYSASLSLIPLMEKPVFLLVPTLLFGIAHGINVPTLQSILAGEFKTHNRAVFMSLNRMIAQAGQVIGPLLMGLVFAGLGLNSVFIIGSIAALTMIIPMFIYIRFK